MNYGLILVSTVTYSLFLLTQCAAERGYVYYLVDPEIEVAEQHLQQPSDQAITIGQTKEAPPPINIHWNDGTNYAEVKIPLLSSGQRVYITHDNRRANAEDPGPKVEGPSPNRSDSVHRELKNAYRSKGLKENSQVADVSLSKTRIEVEKHTRAGDYTLALSYLERALERYPEHAEFLRAKGSLLLLLGEKEKAAEVYEQAQMIEFDPAVARKLDEISRLNF